MSTVVRPFRSTDRAAIRELCCDTGFLGNAIDPVFSDRELFADYLTRYYTDSEPEAAFVVEKDGIVRGYLLGSRCPWRQRIFDLLNNARLFAKGGVRYPGYNVATRNFIRWILTRAWREVPPPPRGIPHFHFNIMPDARSLATVLELTGRYFEFLRAHGETHVFGQIVTTEGRRNTALFERYGFTLLNKAEITKYRGTRPERVYLCTVLKDLRTTPQKSQPPGFHPQ
jgi:hypothetical protein